MALLSRIRGKWLKFACSRTARSRGGAVAGLNKVSLSVPIVADGKGQVILGARSSFGCRDAPICGNGHIRLQARTATARIQIGEQCAFSNNVTLCALNSIVMGNACLIGEMVTIMDADHHELSPRDRWTGSGRIAPVVIGDNVWIGSRVIILAGVTIGANSVIGAGAVVTKSIPPDTVAAGNPARPIRSLV